MFSGGSGMNSGALILVSMLSTAFVAHFNAPKFYSELKDKSVPRWVWVGTPSLVVTSPYRLSTNRVMPYM